MARPSAETLAGAIALLVSDGDVTDTLARVLHECVAQLGAQAAGLMVRDEDGELELLSATSHAVAELELFQIQNDAGPCVDAIRTGGSVDAPNPEELARRWPGVVCAAIESAGYSGARAAPLRWQEHVLGAVNVFYRGPHRPVDGDGGLLQAFADIACLAILQAPALTRDEVTARMKRAFRGRTLVEHAKGVIAYQRGVDPATAYAWLLDAAADGQTLSAVAAGVVEKAQRKNSGGVALP
jgi:GAF domain-containing protein